MQKEFRIDQRLQWLLAEIKMEIRNLWTVEERLQFRFESLLSDLNKETNKFFLISDPSTNSTKQILDESEELIGMQENYLHDLNLYRTRALDYLFDACIDLELWSQAVTVGLKTLPAYRWLHFDRWYAFYII